MKRRLLVFVVSLLLGCAPSWDPVVLQPWQAELSGLGEHRLQDVTPYVLPWESQLYFFLCRFDVADPIPVSLPPDATPQEERALRAAIAAWESAGLGVRFVEAPASQATIQIELIDSDVSGRIGGAGNTIADCRLRDGDWQAAAGAVLPAQLEFASIHLFRRETTEWTEKEHEFFADELAGVALHELGHALGFQGHTSFVAGVMTRDARRIADVGRGLMAGEGFSSATLRALYALPSGLVLRQVPVSRYRTDLVDRMARLAADHQLDGPFVRVGDTQGRVFWRDASGSEYGLGVMDIHGVLSKPERVVVLPEARTRGALPRSRDLRPSKASD